MNVFKYFCEIHGFDENSQKAEELFRQEISLELEKI